MVRLTKDGRLVLRIPGETFKDEDAYIDVTGDAIAYLFYSCALDDDVTLRDVFLLLRTNQEHFDAVFDLDTMKHVAEGLDSPPAECPELKCLELRREVAHDPEWDETVGTMFPNLCGLTESGDARSVGFVPMNELANLPVRLGWLYVYSGPIEAAKAYRDPEYTLGQILYGIMHELTFYGTPEERSLLWADVLGTIEEIKHGDASGLDDDQGAEA